MGQRHDPTALYPRERLGIHCTEGWVVARAGLDRCGKSRLYRDSIPGPSSPYPVAIPTELPGPLCQRQRIKKIASNGKRKNDAEKEMQISEDLAEYTQEILCVYMYINAWSCTRTIKSRS
jgi:hypothetical protein